MKERIINHIYDRGKIDWENLPFTNRQVWRLLLPLMVEQLLASLMGMADTMMVSRIGSAAISAVSLSDSINNLVIQTFAALATGGTIICSQYIGHKDPKRTQAAAEQVVITCAAISITLAALCYVFRVPLLAFIFGAVEDDVMSAAVTYFAFTSVSFPFLAMFQVGSAFYRAGGNSRFPMTISVISNLMNIAGNALFIFVCGWGVAGAALSTLLSRVFCAVVLFVFLRMPRQTIVLRRYLVRPDWNLIWKILAIGVPSGIENSMFQFGKLAIQSSVSTLGTTAIAAQAMTIIFENVNGVGAVGVGIGLMTIVGQCLGAGKKEEAKYYIAKLFWIAEATLVVSCLFAYAIARPVTWLAGMETASANQCVYMLGWITIFKPLFWGLSFLLAYGMRAAGDVRFSMIVSSCTMWMCRVALAIFLIRVMGVGPMAVWVGMFTDWGVRAVIYAWRFLSMRWLNHQVI